MFATPASFRESATGLYLVTTEMRVMSEKTFERRTFMYATGIAGATLLAGCSGGGDGGGGSDGSDGGSDGSDGGDGGGSDGERASLDEEPNYDGWLDDASNYEQTVDWTGQDEVTVMVGYDNLSFDPRPSRSPAGPPSPGSGPARAAA